MGLRKSHPTVNEARLLSSHNLEIVDTAEHPQAVEGARAAGGVVPGDRHTISRTVIGTDCYRSETRVVFWKGDVEVASGTEYTSGSLRNSKPSL